MTTQKQTTVKGEVELLEIMLDAWFNRTLAIVDWKTGEHTPPPTREEWKDSVRENVEKLLAQAIKQERSRVVEMIENKWNEDGMEELNHRSFLEVVETLKEL